MALSYGRIAKIAARLSNGLVNSAMGQIPCSTERISSYYYYAYMVFSWKEVFEKFYKGAHYSDMAKTWTGNFIYTWIINGQSGVHQILTEF